MSNDPQVVSSIVVDGDGTVIAYAARPDDLADDEFWACTYRAVINAACVIQERDGVISDTGVFISPDDTGVFISPDEGWEEEDVARAQREDVARAQRFVADKLPGGRIIETDEDGDTRIVDLAAEESDRSDEED